MTSIPNKNGIGIELQEILREHGLKQVDLAQYLNLTPAAVSQFFHGKTLPSPRQFERILEFLRPDSAIVGKLVRTFHIIRQGGALEKSDINRNLFALRCEAGLSLAKLTELSTVPLARLEELERNPESEPEGEELEQIAAVLKCPVSRLCTNVPEKRKAPELLEAAEGTLEGEIRLPVLTLHDLAFYQESEDFEAFATARAQSYRKCIAPLGAKAYLEASATKLHLRPAATVSLILGSPCKKRRGGLFLGRGQRGGFLLWEKVRKNEWEPMQGISTSNRMNTALWRLPVLEMLFRPDSTSGTL